MGQDGLGLELGLGIGVGFGFGLGFGSSSWATVGPRSSVSTVITMALTRTVLASSENSSSSTVPRP